jgi:hypothetical protein
LTTDGEYGILKLTHEFNFSILGRRESDEQNFPLYAQQAGKNPNFFTDPLLDLGFCTASHVYALSGTWNLG